jgi:uncharacterized membrane protein YfcA
MAGVFAGMFGIGGGIVKGPLMLEMGILPEVSAATAAFMIFFTAGATTITYASFGHIAWSFGGVLLPLGIVFTAIGQVGMLGGEGQGYVREQRQSGGPNGV